MGCAGMCYGAVALGGVTRFYLFLFYKCLQVNRIGAEYGQLGSF